MRKLLFFASFIIFSSSCLYALSLPPYASPFEIKLTNSIGTWTSDFGARSQAVTNNTFPSLSDWYSYDYTAGYPGFAAAIYSTKTTFTAVASPTPAPTP